MSKKLTVDGFEVEPCQLINLAPEEELFFTPRDRILQLERLTAEYEDGRTVDLVSLDDVLRILDAKQE